MTKSRYCATNYICFGKKTYTFFLNLELIFFISFWFIDKGSKKRALYHQHL